MFILHLLIWESVVYQVLGNSRMSEIQFDDHSPTKERRQTENSDGEQEPEFNPIVSLPEVEIVTNEENEEEILKIRAKLYRFDATNDPPEWKERGTGDLKLLRHKDTNSVRVVMRRDKTLKVCANHFITPWMALKPSIGSEKAFVYTVLADFADEKPRSECLAVKFGTIDNANLFKKKFEEAKNIVKTECHLYNGKVDKENEEDVAENEHNRKNEFEDEAYSEITKKISDLEVVEDKI